jgi:hypothetical protein
MSHQNLIALLCLYICNFYKMHALHYKVISMLTT